MVSLSMALIFNYVTSDKMEDISFNSSEIVDWSKLKNKKISIRNWKRGMLLDLLAYLKIRN